MRANKQAGFSLIEVMVGLVVSLLVSLVIMQVFAVFEGQKRSTSGTADAQTRQHRTVQSAARRAISWLCLAYFFK